MVGPSVSRGMAVPAASTRASMLPAEDWGRVAVTPGCRPGVRARSSDEGAGEPNFMSRDPFSARKSSVPRVTAILSGPGLAWIDEITNLRKLGPGSEDPQSSHLPREGPGDAPPPER